MIAEYPTARLSQLDARMLKDLVRPGEGQRLEFKLKTNHPEKIVKSVVAFANTQGGKLLIGIGDDRSIKGLRFSDEDEFLLVRAIEKYCYPMIDYEIERVAIENEREVLIFDIKPSPMKPHYVDLDGIQENRKAYVRVADKSVQASKEMREVLKGERKAQSIKFNFGEKEKTLMQYLAFNQSITVEKFAEIAQLQRKVASRTLVVLVLANVLKIKPNEIADVFVRNEI
jgi:predicted HTH transcriptional regulator